MLERIRNKYVWRYDFSEEEKKEVRERVEKIRLNVNGANGNDRTKNKSQRDKVQGFLAEKAVFNVLRKQIGSLVYQRKTDLSNQVDLFCGTKTIEIRSSKVPDLELAIFKKKRDGDSAYHLVGSYTNSYKRYEIIKDWYVWVTFVEDDYCYLTCAATKKMIEAAPYVKMGGTTKYRALDPEKCLDWAEFVKEIRPANNETLSLAKQNKEDEFYTRYQTIEQELQHYEEQLTGKIVYCPCDDPNSSMFWKFFVDHFKELGLKEIRATSLKGVYARYNGEKIATANLNSGSFNSEECREILRNSDTVITNPPFSLFRDFVKLLISENKDFLIVGSQNSSTTKDIFPLFKQQKVRYGHHRGSEQFFVPDDYETRSKNVKQTEEGRLVTVEGIRWFTTLPVKLPPASLKTVFVPWLYETYDNYPAIEVSKKAEIPIDYQGEMGVPISFLDIWNPEEFELIGTSGTLAGPIEGKERPGRFYLKGQRLYDRIVIKKKILQQGLKQ